MHQPETEREITTRLKKIEELYLNSLDVRNELRAENRRLNASAAMFRDLLQQIHNSSYDDSGSIADPHVPGALLEAIPLALEDEAGAKWLAAFNQMHSALLRAHTHLTPDSREQGVVAGAIRAADGVLPKGEK